MFSQMHAASAGFSPLGLRKTSPMLSWRESQTPNVRGWGPNLIGRATFSLNVGGSWSHRDNFDGPPAEQRLASKAKPCPVTRTSCEAGSGCISRRRHLVEFRQSWIYVVPSVTAHAVRHHLRLVSAWIVKARSAYGEKIRHGRKRHIYR